MSSHEESTYVARTVEQRFISELGWHMFFHCKRKIDVHETKMGDSFGYDYLLTDPDKPHQPLYLQVKTRSGAASSWPIKPILMNNPLMEFLVIDYEDDNGQLKLTYRVFDKAHRQTHVATSSMKAVAAQPAANTAPKGAYEKRKEREESGKIIIVPQSQLLKPMNIQELCAHWFK